jgi:hypothetical protein
MPGSLLLGEEVCGDRWDRAEDEWEDEDNVRLGREHGEALGAGGHLVQERDAALLFLRRILERHTNKQLFVIDSGS